MTTKSDEQGTIAYWQAEKVYEIKKNRERIKYTIIRVCISWNNRNMEEKTQQAHKV